MNGLLAVALVGIFSGAFENENRAEAQFINDSYWLLIPFRRVWDMGCVLTLHEGEHELPTGKCKGRKWAVTYIGGDDDTPGDACGVCMVVDNRIVVWIYRKGNAP